MFMRRSLLPAVTEEASTTRCRVAPAQSPSASEPVSRMPVSRTLVPVVDPAAIQVAKDDVQGSIERSNAPGSYQSFGCS